MKTKSLFALFVSVSLFLAADSVQAQAPNLINYQGRLTAAGGAAASGAFAITFSIYTTATGATPLWSEVQNVTVTNGVFNVLLGSVTPLSGTIFTSGGERYLGIKVGADPEMTPRFRLTSVAFAFHATEADGIKDGAITDADVSADAAISGAKINPDFGAQNIFTTGKVSIGASPDPNPTIILDVNIPSGGVARFGRLLTTGGEVQFTNGRLRSDQSRFQILGQSLLGTTAFPISFGQSAGDVDMLINTNGNVGIGTATPAARLHVVGTARIDTLRFPDGTLQTTAATGGLTLPFSQSTSSSSDAFSIINIGAGRAANFEVNNPNSVSFAALRGLTNSNNNVTAIFGLNSGGGTAGLFEVSNSDNNKSALLCKTAGTGTTFTAQHFGVSGNIAIFQSLVNNLETNQARIDKTGKGFFNGGTQAGGADVAEAFEVENEIKSYSPGEVLVISTGNDRRVEKCREPYSPLVIGVYTTKPGVVLSERDIEADLSDTIPVGVVGVIPTKVSGENGPIRRGDLLVTSSTPGHAMKGTERDRLFGATLGKALENFDGSGNGVIRVMINVK